MQADTKIRWQFGIRHLLGAMFAVALVSALIAPWVRSWSAGQWAALGIQTGSIVLAFVLSVVAHAWTRRRIHQQVGTVLYRVQAQTWGSSAWKPSNAYVMIAFATLMLALLTASTIASGGKFEFPVFQGMYAGVFSALGMTQLLDPPDQMLVGDHGVAIRTQFIPWDRLWCVYQPDAPAAPLFLKTAGWAFELSPAAEIERPVADFLAQRAKPWLNPPQRSKQR